MTTLRIEHIENIWQIGRVHNAPRGGGWTSVEELQISNFNKGWYPPKLWAEWRENVERSIKIERGVLIERYHPVTGWVSDFRLTLED